uniref:Secreted protein n=1 Tax=Caenorhabditis tropicalis TaxID=1561998 RepID=A0A1I7TVA2_9PELO
MLIADLKIHLKYPQILRLTTLFLVFHLSICLLRPGAFSTVFLNSFVTIPDVTRFPPDYYTSNQEKGIIKNLNIFLSVVYSFQKYTRREPANANAF